MTRSSDLVMVEREVLERAHEALSRCYDVNDWPADGTTRQDAALRLLTSAIQSVEGGVQGSIATKQVTDETAASVLSRAAVFVAWAMREGPWEGGDLDGGALQDKAEELGLIVKTTYDPEMHGACHFDMEPGGNWFVLHPAIQAATEAQLTKTPSADHDAGNLRDKLDIAISALEFARDGYERTDIKHIEYRVGVYMTACDALDTIALPSAPNHQPHAVSQGWRDDRVAVARALYEVGRKAIEPTLGMRLCDFEQLEGRDLKLHLDYADAAIKTLRNPPLPAPPSPAKTGGVK